MTVELNGKPEELPGGTTLLSLIERHTATTRGSAVVVDGTVVPRSDWQLYRVRDGQRIELIRAVQGG
jgi:sulfur carrier protein